MSRPVDEIARALIAPLLDARPSADQWRLIAWDVEHGITLTLAKDDRVLLIEVASGDEDERGTARTARFNLYARRLFAGEVPLDAEERNVVAHVARLLRRSERALPVIERPVSSARTTVREIEVDRVLIPEGRGHYYVNPYVGCVIGCAFCWVAERADQSRALEGLPRQEWGRWVDVKRNAPEVLRREVRMHPPGIVRLSPVITDPYQPIERKHRITRQCLEVLVEARFSPVVLTREPRVTEDLGLLAQAPSAAVGLSIPTDDDTVRQRFEPGASPIEERLEALARCHAAGLRTFAVVQPVLPMDPERLVARVAPFVRSVRIDRMHDPARYAELYARAGRPDAATDAFAEGVEAALREGFSRRGVAIDELDDLASTLGVAATT